MIKILSGITVFILASASSCYFWKTSCCEKNHKHTTHSLEKNISEKNTPLPETNKAAEVKQTVLHISTEKDFNNLVLQDEKPIIIKFEAEWCGACKKITDIYNEIAKELNQEYTFATVNIDTAQKIAVEYAIHGVPTIIFMHKGKELNKEQRIIGAFTDKEYFISAIKKAFNAI